MPGSRPPRRAHGRRSRPRAGPTPVRVTAGPSPTPRPAPHPPPPSDREADRCRSTPWSRRASPSRSSSATGPSSTSTPYDKGTVDPYTRTRVILMNGIEVESIIFSHQFARHTDHPELKRALATSRRVDAQQQKAVNGLNPGDQSPLETTIGYEQVAVDLTAWLARHEPDPMVHQALDFALLEDFDHLYRYSDLYDLLYGGRADEITQHLTEITPGTSDGRRTPAPPRRDPHALRDAHRGPADPHARHDHRGGRAADHELLHEPRDRLDRADRPRPLRRDRAHRGAARHPLRVAARPARLVARACGCATSTTRSTCTGRCSSTRATGASRPCGSCT